MNKTQFEHKMLWNYLKRIAYYYTTHTHTFDFSFELKKEIIEINEIKHKNIHTTNVWKLHIIYLLLEMEECVQRLLTIAT